MFTERPLRWPLIIYIYMGWLSDLFKNGTPWGALASTVSSIGDNITSTINTNKTNAAQLAAMRENNDFQAGQSEIQRDWQSEESQLNRQFSHDEAELAWQREMEKMRYESPIEQLKRFREAGINPQVAFSQGLSSASGGSAPMAATPSEASASGSGVSSSLPSFVSSQVHWPNIMDGFLDTMLKIEQIQGLKQDNRGKNRGNYIGDATTQDAIDTAHAQAVSAQVQAEIDRQFGVLKADKELAQIIENIKVLTEQATMFAAQGQLADAQKSVAKSQEELNKALKEYHGENKKMLENMNEWYPKEMQARIDNLRSSTNLQDAQRVSIKLNDMPQWYQNGLLARLNNDDPEQLADYLLAGYADQYERATGQKISNEIQDRAKEDIIKQIHLETRKNNPRDAYYRSEKLWGIVSSAVSSAASAGAHAAAVGVLR